jgi:hypothetical protein
VACVDVHGDCRVCDMLECTAMDVVHRVSRSDNPACLFCGMYNSANCVGRCSTDGAFVYAPNARVVVARTWEDLDRLLPENSVGGNNDYS